MTTPEQIKKVVREKYGAITAQIGETSAGESASCCGPADCGCGGDQSGVITSGLYELGQTEGLPPDVQLDMELWAGCIAGALHETDYRQTLADVGFENIEIEPTRIYSGQSSEIGAYMSAFIRATKPSER